MAAKYGKSANATVMESNGYNNGTLSGDGAYVLYNRLGVCNHISFTVKTSNNWDKFGVSFVRGSDSKKYYTVVVNPEWEDGRKVNFEQEGEEGKGFIEAATSTMSVPTHSASMASRRTAGASTTMAVPSPSAT